MIGVLREVVLTREVVLIFTEVVLDVLSRVNVRVFIMINSGIYIYLIVV